MFLLSLIYKSSYVLRSVSVHWMHQNVRIGSFFNVQLIMHYLNSFLSCSIRNLTLASLNRLFTIKIDVFAPEGVLPYLEVGGAWPQILSLKFLLEPQILPPKI